MLCLSFFSGSGRECPSYIPVLPCHMRSVQVFPPLSQPRHVVFCVQRLRSNSVRITISHSHPCLPDHGFIDIRHVVSRLVRAFGWWGG